MTPLCSVKPFISGVQMLFTLCTRWTEARGLVSLLYQTSIDPWTQSAPVFSALRLRPIHTTGSLKRLRVALLTPLVEPVVDILNTPLASEQHIYIHIAEGTHLGQRHVGDDNGVQGARRLLCGLVLREGGLVPRGLLTNLLRLAFNSAHVSQSTLYLSSRLIPVFRVCTYESRRKRRRTRRQHPHREPISDPLASDSRKPPFIPSPRAVWVGGNAQEQAHCSPQRRPSPPSSPPDGGPSWRGIGGTQWQTFSRVRYTIVNRSIGWV